MSSYLKNLISIGLVLFIALPAPLQAEEDYEKDPGTSAVKAVAAHSARQALLRLGYTAGAAISLRLITGAAAVGAALTLYRNFRSTSLEKRWNGITEDNYDGRRNKDFATLANQGLNQFIEGCKQCEGNHREICRTANGLLTTFRPLYTQAKSGNISDGVKTGLNKITEIIPIVPNLYPSIDEWRKGARQFEKDYLAFAEKVRDMFPDETSAQLWCLSAQSVARGLKSALSSELPVGRTAVQDKALADKECTAWATGKSREPYSHMELCEKTDWGGKVGDGGIHWCSAHARNVLETKDIAPENKPTPGACVSGCLARMDEICYLPYSRYMKAGEGRDLDDQRSETCSDWAQGTFNDPEKGASFYCEPGQGEKLSREAYRWCGAHASNVMKSNTLKDKPAGRGCRNACLEKLRHLCAI